MQSLGGIRSHRAQPVSRWHSQFRWLRMPPGAASLSVAFAAAGRGSLFPCSAQLSLPLCPEQRSATFFLSFFPVQRSAPFSRTLSHAMKWSFFTPFFPGSEAQDFQRLPRFCRYRHPPPPSLSRLRAYTRGGRRLFDALLGEWHCIGS